MVGTSPSIPSWWSESRRRSTNWFTSCHTLRLRSTIQSISRPTSASSCCGRVAHHLALEGALDALAVEQRADPAQPDRLLEEPLPPALHLVQQQLEPGQPRLEVAQHLLVEERELRVDALERLDVLRQQLEPLERGLLVPRREPEPDVERIEQLEPDPLLLVEGAEQVLLDRVEAALLPELGRRPAARACTARRAETGKTCGVSPSSAAALSRT